MSGEEFEGKSSNIESGAPPMRRTIVVRKRKTVVGDGGGVSAIDSGGDGGIGKFDEYIQKSGLDPKAYQREGVEFCLRHEDRRRFSRKQQPTHGFQSMYNVMYDNEI